MRDEVWRFMQILTNRIKLQLNFTKLSIEQTVALPSTLG
jgi:hypothetical protein